MTSIKLAFKYQSVMLIDDNAIDNFINKKLIRKHFFSENVFVHSNASSALEYFKNIKKMENISPVLIPDYIFLDINMPLLDGWDFLQEYERLNLLYSCKIVVLTASVNPEDEEKIAAYQNIVGFFYKPLYEIVLETL